MSRIADLPTLEARWLEFVRRTDSVFAAHPHMIPVRQMAFKEFVDRHTTTSMADRLKGLAKLALRRERTLDGDLSPVDVVFCLNSPREVLVEATLPVMTEVAAMGGRTALLATRSVYEKIDPALKPILFQVPHHRQSTEPWKQGWQALRTALPDDLHADSFAAFCELGINADNTVAEAKRLLLRLQPRVVVMPVDQFLPNSAVCIAAHQLGIQTLVLLHGAVSHYNAPLTAERMGVWGALSLDQMMRYGVPPEDLVILGSPRHDTFPAPLPSDVRDRFRATLGLRDLPIIVFFSNGNDYQFTSRRAVEECAAWLNDAAEVLSDRLELVVRLHPNEDGALYVNYPRLRVFKNECDLAATIASADVCAALCSTVMVDTLLYRKPVLQFYADGWPDLAENWRRGLAHRIPTSQQFTQFLERGLDDITVWNKLAGEQAAATETVFANHGTARGAVAAYIMEQIGQPLLDTRGEKGL